MAGAEKFEFAQGDNKEEEENIDKIEFDIPNNMEKSGKYNFAIPKDLLKKQFLEDCVDVEGMKEGL